MDDAIRNAIPEPVAMMEATVNNPNHLPMGTYHLLNLDTLVNQSFKNNISNQPLVCRGSSICRASQNKFFFLILYDWMERKEMQKYTYN